MTQIPGFRNVPQTGVIYVIQKAIEKGFTGHDSEWINLGQGAPETGPIAGASKRIDAFKVDPALHEYSPVTGQLALRQKIADLYNFLYRQGKKSQYTHENVSIAGGGRTALTRIAASLGNINMGHFIPDYTAYEELLSVFKAFVPIPILLDPACHYQATLEQIKNEITGRGLKAILLSNPCNPTGQLIEDGRLAQWVQLARNYHCSLILDEFYSHYIYTGSLNDKLPKMVSAAAYVTDVDRDPIIIVDGLTKNWRYPGWRLSWTLGPKEVIKTVASAGSFLDGGACSLIQRSILQLLEPDHVIQETRALQNCFLKKRTYTILRLLNMGVKIDVEPQGTFYIWANLSNLPKPLRDGFKFFEAGLDEKVITVPGVFFDVNPENRRPHARFKQYSRISFGPKISIVKQGLDRLERVIKRYS
ncbi:MAG: aspartate aminotransferase [Legionellales bacterium RIFCSPHIGHO2_12_FULL_42_9]|nr:MAG: aspartate aminotransferase [Legionellales bacterium RIFCSPHIGHO2_12_FULL_42_9]